MKKIVLILGVVMMMAGISGCKAETPSVAVETETQAPTTQAPTTEEPTTEAPTTEEVDTESSASVDGVTSASIVPNTLIDAYSPNGFTDSDAKKALFIVGDPRKYSVNYDLIYTAMKHFEENGIEVEIRDLYDINFNPVLSLENFYFAKDGEGTPTNEIKIEQEYVSQADYIIFAYPNWHDTPNAIVKGYMETVFSKKFAYQDTDNGLEGMLGGKSLYTIMNAGFLGGGRGYIGDGVGIDDEAWDSYMRAFEVMDNDTAGFWGMENKGRFVNDRTPKNNSETYADDLETLRTSLIENLNEVFLNQ